jgi:hypothetical protein
MTIFRELKAAIIDALAVPGRFIEACNTLSEVTRDQTNTIEAMHATIASLEKSVKYLEVSRRRELQRAGHHD